MVAAITLHALCSAALRHLFGRATLPILCGIEGVPGGVGHLLESFVCKKLLSITKKSLW
jgi:hypothetical protein